jgi:hypothetical protein
MTDSSISPSAAVAQVTQAKLYAEAARRLEHPVDALPPGDPHSLLLGLWHRAATCAVAAARTSGGPVEQQLERAAGGAELLKAVQTLLQTDPPFTPGEQHAAASQAALLASFTRALLEELERTAGPTRSQRWWRATRRFWIPGVLPLLCLLAAVVWYVRGPELTVSAVRTLSSESWPCVNGACGNATFLTKNEQSPWVRYDFGKPRQLHAISVENRTDCCIERALPLLVETSDDAVKWQEQVRTEQPFYVFRHPLNVKARYLRVRVGAFNYLHLRSVSIR